MTRSEDLFAQAQTVIPGGVNSPVRAFKSVGGTPRFIVSAKGATVTDADGKTYIDYVGSWGPMIVGHAHEKVVSAVQEAAAKGASYGAPTEAEIRLAEKIVEVVPSVEMVRLVNSGTEATMSALRLARAATGRDAFLKFEGCYHGHGDAFLVAAGSGAATFGQPSSPGVPKDTVKDTLTLPMNDIDGMKKLFAERGGDIAAVIVEAVAGNMGLVKPVPGFLETLRDLCTASGAILIFDEVMTGFRVALGGVQEAYDVMPDLTTLGKVIGGGLPVGAYGGRKDLMAQISPSGPVYQAGTLSGNPLATAAGLATLEILTQPGVYETLASRTKHLAYGMGEILTKAGIANQSDCIGSMFGVFFSATPVTNFAEAGASDMERFNKWFQGMLAEGIYLAPSGYEAGFVSLAHGEKEIAETLTAAERVAKTL